MIFGVTVIKYYYFWRYSPFFFFLKGDLGHYTNLWSTVNVAFEPFPNKTGQVVKIGRGC